MNAPTNISLSPPVSEAAEVRVAQYNWKALAEELSSQGCVVIENLISPDECRQIVELYPHERHFRSHVHMARHGFGRGEYRYFKYPLPALIGNLREALYPRLANIANDWNARMKVNQRYPSAHADFLEQCRDQGQTRPTPLLLQYVPGDFNCLHQDLYGELAFPLQVAILLSEPGADFTGGEFCLTEQRPRMQSRVEVVPLRQGDAVAFAVHNRPAAQHAESDRPRATLEPLAWRFLIAELAIGSGSVCAIVYAAISSISISAHSALSSGLSEPWVTTPIPKSPEGTPQQHRDASVKPFRTGACPHDRKSRRARYANLRRDGRQFLGRAEHREPRRPALTASAIRPGAPCGLRQNCRVDKPPRPRARR